MLCAVQLGLSACVRHCPLDPPLCKLLQTRPPLCCSSPQQHFGCGACSLRTHSRTYLSNHPRAQTLICTHPPTSGALLLACYLPLLLSPALPTSSGAAKAAVCGSLRQAERGLVTAPFLAGV